MSKGLGLSHQTILCLGAGVPYSKNSQVRPHSLCLLCFLVLPFTPCLHDNFKGIKLAFSMINSYLRDIFSKEVIRFEKNLDYRR